MLFSVYSFIKWAVATATTTVTGKALVNNYIQQVDEFLRLLARCTHFDLPFPDRRLGGAQPTQTLASPAIRV